MPITAITYNPKFSDKLNERLQYLERLINSQTFHGLLCNVDTKTGILFSEIKKFVNSKAYNENLSFNFWDSDNDDNNFSDLNNLFITVRLNTILLVFINPANKEEENKFIDIIKHNVNKDLDASLHTLFICTPSQKILSKLEENYHFTSLQLEVKEDEALI